MDAFLLFQVSINAEHFCCETNFVLTAFGNKECEFIAPNNSSLKPNGMFSWQQVELDNIIQIKRFSFPINNQYCF